MVPEKGEGSDQPPQIPEVPHYPDEEYAWREGSQANEKTGRVGCQSVTWPLGTLLVPDPGACSLSEASSSGEL